MLAVTKARMRCTSTLFVLYPSRQITRYLHSSIRSQAETTETPAKDKSEEMKEHLNNIEQMHVNWRIHGELDFSGSDVGQLDVHLHPRWRKLPPTGVRGAWRWLRDQYHNGYKNYYAMYQLAKNNAIPDVTISSRFPWTRDAFFIFGSTFHLPMLDQCLQQYKLLQKALASGNERAIRRLSTSRFRPMLIGRIPPQPRKDRKLRYHWKLHSISKPLTFESIRASPLDVVLPGLDKEASIINALVVFDTMQSLAVYDHTGTLIAGSEEPQRVREAFTFEFRSWMPGLPRISDQVYEDGSPYALDPSQAQGLLSKLPGPVTMGWRTIVNRLDAGIDGLRTWWAWKARARAERRLAKSQAKYGTPASTTG